MFSDDERALGEVEHLPRLEAPRHPPRQKRSAMQAMGRFVPNDLVGIGYPPQRVAPVALLPASFEAASRRLRTRG